MTAALRANVNVLTGNYGMSAVVAVERGNSVTPPKLTGDAPVLRILHPVEVVFVESFGNELYSAVANALYGGLS